MQFFKFFFYLITRKNIFEKEKICFKKLRNYEKIMNINKRYAVDVCSDVDVL